MWRKLRKVTQVQRRECEISFQYILHESSSVSSADLLAGSGSGHVVTTWHQTLQKRRRSVLWDLVICLFSEGQTLPVVVK